MCIRDSVGAVRQDGRTFVTVVLGCGWPPHKTYKWSDTRKLMSYGINNFFPQKILVPDPDFGKICVMGGVSDEMCIRDRFTIYQE